ncbi:MAG TPA: M67 family metallopeptidase [Acidimicrobiales bacterium]|nr:M67 family metallopeptidase [Acidimicrobiales bacterium]
MIEHSQIQLTSAQLDEMTAHCLSALPLEGCGLLVGTRSAMKVLRVEPTDNVAKSARLYIVDPRAHLKIDRQAESEGREVIGAFHSHTHTDPYPSPTDVAQAPDPNWHYVLVSLRDEIASTRSYRIVEGKIHEEPIVVVG